MQEEFRRSAKEEFARLLVHWRTVELWVKRAEQVTQKAMIPAINELRYASRQLFNAIRIYDNGRLDPADCKVISKRIIIAEQYLLNSEHDIADGIVGFYENICRGLDGDVGPTAVIECFPEYQFFKKCLITCNELIADARHDYEKRQKKLS